jgi:hypothetical protein
MFKLDVVNEHDHANGLVIWRLRMTDPQNGLRVQEQVVTNDGSFYGTETPYGPFPDRVADRISRMENTLFGFRGKLQTPDPFADYRISDEKTAGIKAAIAGDATGNKVLLLL